MKNNLIKESDIMKSSVPTSYVILCILLLSYAFWSLFGHLIQSLILLCSISFCALHTILLFLRSHHPSIITVLCLTGMIILCSSHQALHNRLRSYLSKVTTSKIVHFWCSAFPKFLTDIISSMSFESRCSDDRVAPKTIVQIWRIYVPGT